MSITFNSYKDAQEYAWQKREEGHRVYLTKEKGKSVVYLVGKMPTIDKKRWTGDTGIQVSYNDSDSVRTIYNKILRNKDVPKRTSKDIKEIAKRELQKEKIEDIELYVTDKLSDLNVATTNYPKRKSERIQVGFHPIMKHVNKDYLRDVIRHEIEHIKEYNKKNK